jgi:predicted dehydrogenase
MIFKVLILGLGNIGLMYDLNNNYHLSHFKAFYSNRKFKIIGVSDVNKKKKNFFKKKKIDFFLNYKKKLKKLNPDIIVISTPTNSHFKILKNIINHKSVKLILCEKPFCSNLLQAKKIISLNNSKKIYINYMRSSDDTFYKKVINEIKIKKILFIEVFYRGSLLNNASHYIQLLNQYFGKCKKIVNISYYNSDFFDFTLVYSKKIRVQFFSSDARGLSLDSLRLYSSKTIINYDNGGHLIYKFIRVQNPIYSTQNYFKLKNVIKNKFYENPQKKIVTNIYKCILKKKHNLCDITSAMKVHEIIKKIRNG